MTAMLQRPSAPVPAQKRPVTPARIALHVFLILTCLMTLAPLLWAVYASLRTYDDTSVNGYFSVAKSLTFENFAKAWEIGDLPHFYWNTFLITIPALIITLLLSSMVAFGVSRFSFKFNLLLLMVFTAGNLLPQQVVVTPLWRLYRMIEVPEWISASGSLIDSQLGVILIHIAFQSGFCTFVLSNYMKTLPRELVEAALVDGASLLRTFWQVIMPLCRPPLAALATLESRQAKVRDRIAEEHLAVLAAAQAGEPAATTLARQRTLRALYDANAALTSQQAEARLALDEAARRAGRQEERSSEG